ncbi:MAG: hypothetical protein Q9182_007357 [Xanthomendoza sp. 2 TL-2023]
MFQVDVVICGGGPVGLLLACCLARYGIQTYVAEQHDKASQPMYGRAAMIAPRSLEMLDQLDLADALGQIGFVVRGQKFFREGKMVDNMSSAPTSNITDTFFDYCLLCRQRYTEAVMSEAYTSYSKSGPNEIFYGHKLVDISIANGASSPPNHSHPITATFSTATGHETTTKVQCKYLIGADGGSSTVRSLVNIPFPGSRSDHHWIRIDGRVRTNMPHARSGLCGLDSPTHGSILWASLDHGITRVGFPLPAALWSQHGHAITQETVVAEAKKAVLPFELDFDEVDWWTLYSVGQRLAETYRGPQTHGADDNEADDEKRIFLAGDAAHTHSSAAAQGMNTGLHDATNLAWKLAGRIHNTLQPWLLETYESERRPLAQQIIAQDRLMTRLTQGEIPEDLQDDDDDDDDDDAAVGKDAAELMAELFQRNTKLNTGLGIQYPIDGALNVGPDASAESIIAPGSRAPDVQVQRPGPRVPVRLHTLMKNSAVRFDILVFAGDPERTVSRLGELRSYLGDHSGGNNNTTTTTNQSFLYRFPASRFRFLTVVQTPNDNGAAEEKLRGEAFGTIVYDVDGSAHSRYGIDVAKGAVVVVRPDGVVGTVAGLGEGERLGVYFQGILVESGGGREEKGGERGVRREDWGGKGMGEVEVEVEGGKVREETSCS